MVLAVTVISRWRKRSEVPRNVNYLRAIMPTQTLLGVLTVVNLGLFGYQSIRPAPPPGVLRGRALEIVGDRGKARASITIMPEDPKVLWKGKPYPAIPTVTLRMEF
jgi:hypothetical protein